MRCSRWAVPVAASLATINLLGAHPAARATPGNKTSFLAATSARARPATPPGEQLWVRRYNGPGNSTDDARALGVSPDGSQVFVTGDTLGSRGFDYATVAYDASTGTGLWKRRYNGQRHSGDGATELAVSPDGSKVFVTGRSARSSSSIDYATVAYDASTGTGLWVRRYNGPGNYFDIPTALAVGPDGSKVFVTGISFGRKDRDYATVAYDASTGSTLWVRRYNDQRNGLDDATALAVKPRRVGGIRDRVQLRIDEPQRLRHRGLRRLDRHGAVGAPVQRPGEQLRRRYRPGGEPRWVQGVRDWE
jgi:hypothetical protein